MGNKTLRAGIIYKEGSAESRALAEAAVGQLRERGLEVRSLESQPPLFGAEPCAEANWSAGLDLVVVLGGDGTLLRAAQLIDSPNVPVLGVKVGGLGFLTEVRPDELPAVLETCLTGEARTLERMMLEAEIVGPEGSVKLRALNEIAVTCSGMPRVVDLDAQINGVFVTSFRADGLLISSPTGSTAYCMAAGGPIVHRSLRCLIITQICPHTLTSRPLVIPDSSVVTVTLGEKTAPVHVSADSQKDWPLLPGQKVEVTAAPRGISLVCASNRNFYDVLRTKLRWGER